VLVGRNHGIEKKGGICKIHTIPIVFGSRWKSKRMEEWKNIYREMSQFYLLEKTNSLIPYSNSWNRKLALGGIDAGLNCK